MILKYCCPNRETSLPVLTDPEQLLEPHEFAEWNDELARRVNLQELHEGLEIEFPLARNLPTRFRVSKAPGPSNRVPDYTLKSVEPYPAPAGATVAGWPLQFLAEVRAHVQALHADKESRPGLAYLLDDLAELVRQQPEALALQLAHAFAALQYLRYAAAPAAHRRALTYYEISLDALDAELLKGLRSPPATLAHRVAVWVGLLRPAAGANGK